MSSFVGGNIIFARIEIIQTQATVSLNMNWNIGGKPEYAGEIKSRPNLNVIPKTIIFLSLNPDFSNHLNTINHDHRKYSYNSSP